MGAIRKRVGEEYSKPIKSNDLEMFFEDKEVIATIDRLELQGLKVFKIDGEYPTISIYFRPISIVKYLQGDKNTSTKLEEFKVKINDEVCDIKVVNKVKESLGKSKKVQAYLLNVELPKSGLNNFYNSLFLSVKDKEGNVGEVMTSFH